jgi:hypothetical protein
VTPRHGPRRRATDSESPLPLCSLSFFGREKERSFFFAALKVDKRRGAIEERQTSTVDHEGQRDKGEQIALF